MNAPEPNTEQITIWRNLLDSFAQLSAAWQAAEQAQRTAEQGAGPGTLQMPDSLVTSFSRAGSEASDALSGVAAVLSRQTGNDETFEGVAESQREARDAWVAAHSALSDEES